MGNTQDMPMLVKADRTVDLNFERVPEWHDVRKSDDTKAKHLALSQRTRDQMVYIARLKILENEINQCAIIHGPTSKETCKELVKEYGRRLNRINSYDTIDNELLRTEVPYAERFPTWKEEGYVPRIEG